MFGRLVDRLYLCVLLLLSLPQLILSGTEDFFIAATENGLYLDDVPACCLQLDPYYLFNSYPRAKASSIHKEFFAGGHCQDPVRPLDWWSDTLSQYYPDAAGGSCGSSCVDMNRGSPFWTTWTTHADVEISDRDETTNQAPLVGGSGWAMLFDGESDIIKVAMDGPLSAISVSYWMRASEVSPFHCPLSLKANSGFSGDFAVFSDWVLDVWDRGVAMSAIHEGFKPASVGFPDAWFHVAISWDISSGQFCSWVNGELQNNFTISQDQTSLGFDENPILVLGGDADATGDEFEIHQMWSGVLDDVFIFGNPIRTEDVVSLYTTSTLPIDSFAQPIVDFSFDVDLGAGLEVHSGDATGVVGDLYGADVDSQRARTACVDACHVASWTMQDVVEGYGPTWVASSAPSASRGPVVLTLPLTAASLNITLPAADPEEDPVTFMISLLPTRGYLEERVLDMSPVSISSPGVLNGTTGELTYVLDQALWDENEGIPSMHVNANPVMDFFEYCASDALGATSCSYLYLLANHPPFAANRTYYITEDTDVIINLPCHDQDGDMLLADVAQLPDNGTLFNLASDMYAFPIHELAALNAIQVDPASDEPNLRLPDYYGPEINESARTVSSPSRAVLFSPADEGQGSPYATFSYTCTDSLGQTSNEATLVVHVDVVNDPPNLMDHVALTCEDDSVLVTLRGSDVDSHDLLFSIVAAPENGSLSALSGEVVPPGSPSPTIHQYPSRALSTLLDMSATNGSDPDLARPPQCYPSYGTCTRGLCVTEDQYLLLQYDVPVVPKEIALFEVYQPGSVGRVQYLPDGVLSSLGAAFSDLLAEDVASAVEAQWVTLWEGTDVPSPSHQEEARIFRPPFCPQSSVTSIVRVLLNISHDPDRFSSPYLDAIELAGFLESRSSPLLLAAGPELLYTPRADDTASYHATFAASDCVSDSTASLFLTMCPVNDFPVAMNASNHFAPASTSQPTTVNFQSVDVDSTDVFFVVTSVPGEFEPVFDSAGHGYATSASVAERTGLNASTTSIGLPFDIEGSELFFSIPAGFSCHQETYDFLFSVRDDAGATSITDGVVVFNCSAYVPVQESCSAGSYYNDVEGTCLSCPVGTCAPTAGASVCMPCQAGYFTDTEGSIECTPCDVYGYASQEGQSQCTPCPAGSLRVHSQPGTSATQCVCDRGYYWAGYDADAAADAGDVVGCLSCPEGGVCEGGYIRPYPKDGYWGDPVHPSMFMECFQDHWCKSNYSCSPGRKGVMCSECDGSFFSLGGECYECSEDSGFQTIFNMVVLLAEVLVWLAVHKAAAAWSASSPYLFLSWLQSLAMIFKLHLRWINDFDEIEQVLWISLIDVDYFQPTCAASGSGWPSTLSLSLQYAAPCLAMLVLAAWDIFSRKDDLTGRPLMLSARSFDDVRTILGDFWRDVIPSSDFVASMLVLLDLMYPVLLMKTFLPYVCQEMPGSTFALVGDPDIECATRDQTSLIWLSCLGMVLYVLGVPVLFALLASREKDGAKQLYFSSTGQYRFLTSRFAPQRPSAWHVSLLCRRLVLSLSVVTMATSPLLQAGFVSFALIAALTVSMMLPAFPRWELNTLDGVLLGAEVVIVHCGIWMYVGFHPNKAFGLVVFALVFGTCSFAMTLFTELSSLKYDLLFREMRCHVLKSLEANGIHREASLRNPGAFTWDKLVEPRSLCVWMNAVSSLPLEKRKQVMVLYEQVAASFSSFACEKWQNSSSASIDVRHLSHLDGNGQTRQDDVLSQGSMSCAGDPKGTAGGMASVLKFQRAQEAVGRMEWLVCADEEERASYQRSLEACVHQPWRRGQGLTVSCVFRRPSRLLLEHYLLHCSDEQYSQACELLRSMVNALNKKDVADVTLRPKVFPSKKPQKPALRPSSYGNATNESYIRGSNSRVVFPPPQHSAYCYDSPVKQKSPFPKWVSAPLDHPMLFTPQPTPPSLKKRVSFADRLTTVTTFVTDVTDDSCPPHDAPQNSSPGSRLRNPFRALFQSPHTYPEPNKFRRTATVLPPPQFSASHAGQPEERNNVVTKSLRRPTMYPSADSSYEQDSVSSSAHSAFECVSQEGSSEDLVHSRTSLLAQDTHPHVRIRYPDAEYEDPTSSYPLAGIKYPENGSTTNNTIAHAIIQIPELQDTNSEDPSTDPTCPDIAQESACSLSGDGDVVIPLVEPSKPHDNILLGTSSSDGAGHFIEEDPKHSVDHSSPISSENHVMSALPGGPVDIPSINTQAVRSRSESQVSIGTVSSSLSIATPSTLSSSTSPECSAHVLPSTSQSLPTSGRSSPVEMFGGGLGSWATMTPLARGRLFSSGSDDEGCVPLPILKPTPGAPSSIGQRTNSDVQQIHVVQI